MKLPNAENVVIDAEKLTEYCLNVEHPRGKHKARAFASACGITVENAEILRSALSEAARGGEATARKSDAFGQRYMIEWTVTGPTGTAQIITAWIVRDDEDFPRFTSAYIC